MTSNSGPGVDGDDIEEGTVGRPVELASGTEMITLADNGVATEMDWLGLSAVNTCRRSKTVFSRSSILLSNFAVYEKTAS